MAPWPRTTPPQVMSPTTTSLQRLMSNTPRSPQASSGSLMTSTTMTSPPVRRSSTRAEDEPITLKKKACRPVCRRQSVMIERGNPLFAHLSRAPRNSETQLWKWTEWDSPGATKRADSRWLSSWKTRVPGRLRQKKYSKVEWNDRVEKEEICRAHQGDDRRRQDQQLLHEQLLKQILDLREVHEKSLIEMEELKRFQGSTFDTIARRKVVEDRDTILEHTGKIQELQNEINCMNDSRDFQDAESVRSGHFHVTSQPVSFPLHPDPGGMLSRSIGMPSCREGPPSIWDTRGISGNVFANPARLLQHLIRRNWIRGVLMYRDQFAPHRQGSMETKHQFKIRDASPDRQPKVQSSLVREILQRIMGQTNNDCKSQIFILTNSPRQQHLLFGRWDSDWGMHLFTVSYGSYAVDQRSGDCWFSGWLKNFVICKRNSNARFWSTRCEDCFSTEQNHP